MTELTNADFAEFFRELWGHPPFAWQKDLATRVLEESDSSSVWPEAIALPTASGKTACMDIAVFALAAQASRLGGDQPITAPRRMFFVVDRRVIVDQAYEHARIMSRKLKDAKEADDGILKEVADNLRQIAYGETMDFENELPLSAHMLRGGMYRSEAWARDPLQPMVVASTVDQVGSRLLFRPYGPSSRTAPIYAGLIANDSLIFLDEAHCAQPFMQTLHAVRKYREWAHEPLGRKFYPVIMSATPPSGISDVFKDDSIEKDDPSHPLGKRQRAEKATLLKRVVRAKGNQAILELSKALAEESLGLVSDERRAIVIFVNRVATARATHDLLSNSGEEIEPVLLTGRMRPIDKDLVTEQRLAELHSDRASERHICKPKIVVSTQTLEVGADLDFDGLVTECASIDALRQRFGRLNRTGRPIETRGVVLIRDDQAQPRRGDRPDPVYGDALKNTWDWLNEIKDENDEVDFGISNFSKYPSDANDLNTPSLDAAVMLPAHVDCWAQTSPWPEPSPDVALFLHGPQESVADVQVCWRADLDLSDETGVEASLESLRLCPPSSPETLPVPIGVFKRWLSGRETGDDTGDVEGIGGQIDDQDTVTNPSEQRNVVRWRGVRDTFGDHVTSDQSEIRSDDVIVIPTSHPSEYDQIGSFAGKHSETFHTLDIGDQAQLVARAKPTLRLHANLISGWPMEAESAKELARELLDDVQRRYEEDPDEVVESIDALLKEIPNDLSGSWCWLSDAAEWLKGTAPRNRTYRIIGKDHMVISGKTPMPKYTLEADVFSDEDDSSASGISHRNGQPVKLLNHLCGVESFARRYAVGCGLPEDLTDAVACAGLLHDLGKADPRFQALLRGGNRWLIGEPLAKSGQMPSRQEYRRVREAAGYPRGGRHELLSVRLVESSDGLISQDEDLRGLVLHLIASHHGHCRPFAPVISDEECVHSSFELDGHSMQWSGPTNLERLDSGVADRYWQLVRRYGWWGLAWLEAVVRLADWRRSEWEQTDDG